MSNARLLQPDLPLVLSRLEELTQQVAAPGCGGGERGEKIPVARCLDVGLGGPPSLSVGDLTVAFGAGNLPDEFLPDLPGRQDPSRSGGARAKQHSDGPWAGMQPESE